MRYDRPNLFAILLAFVAMRAGADIPPEILGQLDAPDFATREQATAYLTSSDSISESELMTVLERRRQSLSPEQYDRILHVLEDRFMGRPGVLGIRFDNALENPQITITWIEPTAPAARVLRVGDTLLEINEVNLRPGEGGGSASSRLSGRLQRCRAGDSVRLQLERDGRTQDVQVQLVDPSQLGGDFEISFRLERYQADRAEIWQEEFINRFEPSPDVLALAVEEAARRKDGPGSDQSLGPATRLQGQLRTEFLDLIAHVENLEREADQAGDTRREQAIREELAEAMDRLRRIGAYLEIAERDANYGQSPRGRVIP